MASNGYAMGSLATAPSALLPVVSLIDDEPALVRRAQAREEAAFAALYRSHVPRVHALCLRLCPNPGKAEELTQSVFVALWDKLPAFRGECGFSTWLHRFTVNLVLTDLRATRRREARVFSAEKPEDLETPPEGAPAGLRQDLEQAIAALPAQTRTVFVLHEVEGYTHEEIAALMRLAPGTTKAHLHHARKRLQEALR